MPSYRNAVIDDLDNIVSIYNSTIATRMVTADTEEVSTSSKRGWFEAHNEQLPLWVIEDEEKNTIGWVSFQAFYGRPAYAATAEISIYLHHTQRGKGLGKEILLYTIGRAKTLGLKTLIGYIFSHNLPSLKLFRHAGFDEWGHLPNIASLDGVERSLLILGRRID
ncbi:N-acetyltransferase [Sediminibacterium roseum]|uniref:N-acetyltransferase n=1 Tax=Sediminibacterium roseum TaxID=1978412 RepID=A0ABW9ZWZ4_9BACT|nr:GNAT family N-acetyltransferase [Sediminibacterium roseum]NCI51045.1 N-acetyltransferase [Sediminibacterium roseum]